MCLNHPELLHKHPALLVSPFEENEVQEYIKVRVRKSHLEDANSISHTRDCCLYATYFPPPTFTKSEIEVELFSVFGHIMSKIKEEREHRM